MKDRTRLGFVSIVGIVGLIGQVVLLWTFLPRETNALVKREADRRLEAVAARYQEEVLNLGAETALRLDTAARQTGLLAKPGGADLEALAATADLAERLARDNNLTELILLDSSGLVRSAYPEAARVGLKAPEWLALARSASKRPALIRPEKQSARAEAESEVLRLAFGRSCQEGQLWLLSRQPLQRRDLENAALRLQASFDEWTPAPAKADAPSAEQRAVALVGPDQETLATVKLGASGLSGSLLQRLLDRRLLFLAVPWTLGFTFLLAWLGWPPKRGKRKERQ